MPKHQERILFLKEFTKELVINSKISGFTLKISEPLKEETQGIFMPSSLITSKQEEKPKFLVPEKTRYRIKIAPIHTRELEMQKKPAIMTKIPSKTIPVIMPEPTSETLDLGKINFLVQDTRVTIIECPGPNEFIIAKTSGQPQITQISLSQEEIQNIIKAFSQATKIPVISGLFKAAIGNMIITAVISDLVGSRFIITKMTPRFMMEQGSQGS